MEIPQWRFAGGCQTIDFVRRRTEDVVIDPLRLAFLSLVAGYGASARWILFLRKISGKISCLESSVRLVRVSISGLGWSNGADGVGAAERAFYPVWGLRLLVAGSVHILRCWMKMAVLRSGVLGDDPRPTCHRGQGIAARGGRLNRFSKQLDCDGVAPNPGFIRPASWRRQIDVDEGVDVQEDFIGPCLFFIFSEVLCALLPEQWFPLYFYQLYLYLYLYVSR
ncbi:unnamed protein product [Urochloa humidicola]